ncbi:MAG TPA: carboxymuconolactone decarboxylase family protein [Bosea sp. (in: a-proteobacteria)]|uniref:carboxymuconolactone decarboxylase family protein n=1 Tax=Bosea sp. (in: a-proteobacteria) TaxID=1871050 RepID=UPI002E1504F4|nr:carboxymuconolactone decarboxylase family protein [Bosea sp. (in: a-proteobacteria)]
MTQRVEYGRLSADLFKKYAEFSMALKKSAIEPGLRDLVNIRASQLNGCAFCVDMHVKEAKLAGERELRVHHVAVWWESPLFSARERAALEWTEALTKLADKGVSDEIYLRVREQFDEKEISDLTFAVMAINGWNRASVAFRAVPGSQDAAYGLTKAGLS